MGHRLYEDTEQKTGASVEATAPSRGEVIMVGPGWTQKVAGVGGVRIVGRVSPRPTLGSPAPHLSGVRLVIKQQRSDISKAVQRMNLEFRAKV